MVSSKGSNHLYFDFESLSEDRQKDMYILNTILADREGLSAELLTHFDNSLQEETMNSEAWLHSIVLVAALTVLETSCALPAQSTATPDQTAAKRSLLPPRSRELLLHSIACTACTFVNIGTSISYCQICSTKLPKATISTTSKDHTKKADNIKKIAEVIVIDDSSDDDENDDSIIDLSSDSKRRTQKGSPVVRIKTGVYVWENFRCYIQVAQLRATAEQMHSSMGRSISNPSIECSRSPAVSGFVDGLSNSELELLGSAAKRYSLKNPLQGSSKRSGDHLSPSPPSQQSSGIITSSDSGVDDSIPNCFDVFGKRFGDPKRKGKSKFCGTCIYLITISIPYEL